LWPFPISRPINDTLAFSTEDSAQVIASYQRVSPKLEPRWCGHHLEFNSTQALLHTQRVSPRPNSLVVGIG
ncbi:hypothetical protein M422DRAFT_38536, partial [Sphaerobolus stellatus SS14]